MKKFKNLLALLLVLVTAVSFTACGKTDKKEEKKEDFSQMETIYHQLEERMKSVIGSKVAIHSRNYKKGKIEIEYYSNDELERIIDLIESVKQVG